MKISIIIPVYNEQENLVKRLSFLTSHTNNNFFEIIVSISPETTDDSFTICKNFKSVKPYIAPKKGRSCQMNFGASKASTSILLFLHADVCLPIDFYDEILKAISNGYKFGYFAYQFDKQSVLLNFNSKFTTKKGWFSGGGDQCHFISKSAFDDLGGYDETYCLMEDFKLISRIKKAKIPYTIIQSKATVSARKYEKNTWLKVNLINAYVFFLFKIGINSSKLREIYKSLLRESV